MPSFHSAAAPATCALSTVLHSTVLNRGRCGENSRVHPHRTSPSDRIPAWDMIAADPCNGFQSQGDVRSSPMAYPAVRTLPKLPRYLYGQRGTRTGEPLTRTICSSSHQAQSLAIALRSPATQATQRSGDLIRYFPTRKVSSPCCPAMSDLLFSSAAGCRVAVAASRVEPVFLVCLQREKLQSQRGQFSKGECTRRSPDLRKQRRSDVRSRCSRGAGRGT